MLGMTVFALMLISGDFEVEASRIEMPGIWLVMIRWILAWLVHLILDKDLKQGRMLAKYTLNHPWKFSFWLEGILVASFQFFLALAVEGYSILILLSAWSYLDAVKDFVAVHVINEFDEMIFEYFFDDNVSKLIQNGEV